MFSVVFFKGTWKYIFLIPFFFFYSRELKLSGFFFFPALFIYLFLAVLGRHCCERAFPSCGELGLLSSCGAWASHCGGFSGCRAQAQGVWAPVVAAWAQ